MRRVLIVEDSKIDQDLLLAVLKPFGWEAVTCETGEQALALFSPRKFSAVLCDLALPGGMDGFELIGRLRKLSSEIHIDVVSGSGDDPRLRERAILAGATGFFTKPYTSGNNRLLLAQLESAAAAFRRGKRIMGWRTTVLNSVAAAGGLMWGGAVVLIQANSRLIPAGLVTALTCIGLFLNVAGLIGAGICQADKQDVEDLEKQVRINTNKL